ncbi:MAG: hypothetical protein FD123_1380 [Bacteroidetes bacterium]|nr:MAG: hypothetical protein FD123_1380 [Bacteroidota bacterium]
MSRSNYAIKIMVIACFVLLLSGFVAFRSGAFDHFFLSDAAQTGYENAESAGVAYARKRTQDAEVDSLRDNLQSKPGKTASKNTTSNTVAAKEPIAAKEPELPAGTQEMMASSKSGPVFSVYRPRLISSSKTILFFEMPWPKTPSPFRLPMMDSISKEKLNEEK